MEICLCYIFKELCPSLRGEQREKEKDPEVTLAVGRPVQSLFDNRFAHIFRDGDDRISVWLLSFAKMLSSPA